MRIHVSHETLYRYEQPVGSVIQTLRLTPRNHDGQYVVGWRIDVSANCELRQYEDAFGNITHVFTADGPISELTVAVNGKVETQDTNGVVHGTVEHFPPSLFLRDTPLTQCDPAIALFAQDVRRGAADNALSILHALLAALHRNVAFDTSPTGVTTTAAQAFALKAGVCQDLAHIFIAAARSLGIPARYIGGHLHRSDGVIAQDAGHAWAEAFVPDLGWVAFDPANGIAATDAHVRVAVGLDYLGAAPVRGSRQGGGAEALEVVVQVEQAARQTQN